MSQNHILVTGGAGYIGSHVCKVLAQADYIPVTYDNLCSGHQSAVKWGPFEYGDLRDRARLGDVMEKYRPVAIIHLAALIQVGDSVHDPMKFYENNVFGSLCLLSEARERGIDNIVLSSTAAVYGLPKTSPVDASPIDARPIDECAPLQPINPYGKSKLAMENMVRDFGTAYGLHYAVLRYFNAAGADPQAETGTAYKVDTHLIPLLMQVAAGQMPQIKIFGTDYDTPDGTAVRDYIHVTDLAQAHLAAVQHLRSGGASLTVNLGTNHGYSVRQVIDAVRRITGRPIAFEECPRRAGDPAVLIAAATQARHLLGWCPLYSDLETIISTAWRWRLNTDQLLTNQMDHINKEVA